MPSHETDPLPDTVPPAEGIADDALAGSGPAPSSATQEDRDTPNPRRRVAWIVFSLLIAIPLGLTLAGALTSPPRARSVPTGHIIFLEADQPSEHTSLLRGLRITLPGNGQSRELLHETEPQDTDSGSRDWLTQPQASPDGRWLAYEKQVITIQEEKQGVDNQLWALRLSDVHPRPRELLDLTARKLKQPIGLAWTPDSRSVVFLEDALEYRVALDGAASVTSFPIATVPPLRRLLFQTPSLSATRHPALLPSGVLAFEAQAPSDGQIVLTGNGQTSMVVYGQGVHPVWAVAPDGRLATALSSPAHQITLSPALGTRGGSQKVAVQWGWSVFGGRRITSLKWSPEGRFLGYSVSKPPFEDELFSVDMASGRCYQLPIRTGQAAWDWTR